MWSSFHSDRHKNHTYKNIHTKLRARKYITKNYRAFMLKAEESKTESNTLIKFAKRYQN